MKSKWIVISLIVSALSGACTTTQQSRMGIGLGLAGSAVGVGISRAAASGGDSGVVTFGLALGLVSSWAMLAGVGSLGPNVRLDRLEDLSGFTPQSVIGAPPVVPGAPASATDGVNDGLVPAPLTDAWSGFIEAPEARQNGFLISRRATQVIGIDPFIILPQAQGCPELHTVVRLIDVTMNEARHVVCRRMVERAEEPAAD
jgi:hypothetical protein